MRSARQQQVPANPAARWVAAAAAEVQAQGLAAMRMGRAGRACHARWATPRASGLLPRRPGRPAAAPLPGSAAPAAAVAGPWPPASSRYQLPSSAHASGCRSAQPRPADGQHPHPPPLPPRRPCPPHGERRRRDPTATAAAHACRRQPQAIAAQRPSSLMSLAALRLATAPCARPHPAPRPPQPPGYDQHTQQPGCAPAPALPPEHAPSPVRAPSPVLASLPGPEQAAWL